MEISTEWSLAWGIACILFALALSLLLYHKFLFKDSERIRRILFVLRFVIVLVLSFFLLKPFINQNKIIKERPIINIGVDNSTSIVANSDSVSIQQSIRETVSQLTNQLSNQYQVQVYAFGESLEQTTDFNFSHKKTDIHLFINEISDLYKNRNVAANIVISDGIYNSSVNPIYANYTLNAPLHTILLGDTIQKKDLQIAKVYYNELSYLGNTFPIKVDVMAQYCQQEKVKVSIWNEGIKLDEKEQIVGIDNELISFEFKLSSDQTGVQKYTIEVEYLPKESNTQNNEQDIFVDILESKEKIILISDKTHPDISAISQAIESNDNYELTLFSSSDFDGDFSPYSLAILFQTELDPPSIPTLYFTGQNSPTKWMDWIELKQSSYINEVQADYTPFSLFTLNQEWKNWINQLPPLYSHQSDVVFKSEHYDLFYQRILDIETKRPVFSFSNVNGQRQGLCFVEGLWKWRLFEFAKNDNQQLFDELINKSIQYLSVKTDKRPLRLKYENIILENDPFVIQAELYNSNYELINDPDISLSLVDENGVDYPYTFNKSENSYFLEIDNLKRGNYSMIAKTILNGKELTNFGQFSVKPLEIEKMNIIANHQSLYALSEKYNGKSYFLNQQEVLINDVRAINGAVISYTTKSTSDLINLKWISVLLFVFLTLEWLIRKLNTNI